MTLIFGYLLISGLLPDLPWFIWMFAFIEETYVMIKNFEKKS